MRLNVYRDFIKIMLPEREESVSSNIVMIKDGMLFYENWIALSKIVELPDAWR